MEPLTIGSLFTGYGGLDMAVSLVWNSKLAWTADNAAGPSKLIAHRHPGVPNLGDVSNIDWTTVEPVDVITGGFPCQDLSMAGSRAGLREGTRSGLWAEMAHAIGTLRPRLVVIENVRGLLSAHADSSMEPCPWCVGDTGTGTMRALGAVLADLAGLGYDAQWTSLRIADLGGCHNRFRVFILAHPADSHSPGREEPRRIFPTPTPYPAVERHRSGPVRNVADGRFGRFAVAVARHAILAGRPAPDPTEPHPATGAEALAPRFVEWMQCVPAGWVTDVPNLTRNEQLALFGNGVCPPQAAAAIRRLAVNLP